MAPRIERRTERDADFKGAVRLVAILGALLSLPAIAQCTKDVECKGDRICVEGVCVNPGDVPSVDTSTKQPVLTPAARAAERPQLLAVDDAPRPSRFEVGRMLAESGVGLLMGAAIAVLPYFLLFNGTPVFGGGDDPTSSLLLIAIFAAVPLATAPTEFAIAHGSRAFHVDLWPAMVAGVATQALVLGLYYLTGWLPTIVDSVSAVPRRGASCSTNQNSGLQTCGGSLPLLLIGTIAVVPLIEMAVINIFKQPIHHLNDDVAPKKSGQGVTWQPPSVVPILLASDGSRANGVQFSLLRGTW